MSFRSREKKKPHQSLLNFKGKLETKSADQKGTDGLTSIAFNFVSLQFSATTWLDVSVGVARCLSEDVTPRNRGRVERPDIKVRWRRKKFFPFIYCEMKRSGIRCSVKIFQQRCQKDYPLPKLWTCRLGLCFLAFLLLIFAVLEYGIKKICISTWKYRDMPNILGQDTVWMWDRKRFQNWIKKQELTVWKKLADIQKLEIVLLSQHLTHPT